MRWPANICYLGYNQDSNSWGGRFRRVIIDDHPLNKVFEDEELDDEVKEETVGQKLDVDGGKISENAAVRHDDHHVPVGGPPVLASSFINFVVKGLTTRFTALVGSWPVEKLSGSQLYFLTIHVIKKLEEVGFVVDRIVGDNAKVNKKLFKLLRKPADKDDFRVTHPAEPSKTSRKWYVSYGPTHILKKERNQLLERNLKWEGEKIDFSLIELIYLPKHSTMVYNYVVS